MSNLILGNFVLVNLNYSTLPESKRVRSVCYSFVPENRDRQKADGRPPIGPHDWNGGTAYPPGPFERSNLERVSVVTNGRKYDKAIRRKNDTALTGRQMKIFRCML